MTIQETNDTFMRLLHSKISRDEVAQAHREAMLAVLDEAEAQFMFRGKAIRKEIQELGKEPVKAEGS